MSSLKHLEAMIAAEEQREKRFVYVALSLLIILSTITVVVSLMSKSVDNNPSFVFVTLDTSRPLSPLDKIKLKDEINMVLKFHESTVGFLEDAKVSKINTEIE